MPAEITRIKDFIGQTFEVELGGTVFELSRDLPILLAERIAGAYRRIVEQDLDEKFMAECRELALEILSDVPVSKGKAAVTKLPPKTSWGEVTMLIVIAQQGPPQKPAPPARRKKTATARKRTAR